MVAEATCASKPWTVIPMVVTQVQDFIAAGQFRGGEQLIDAQQVVRPGTILVFLEPLYEGGLDGVTPGSSCIANAYTSNHDLIASGQVGATQGPGSPRGGCRRARACHDPAHPGADVSRSRPSCSAGTDGSAATAVDGPPRLTQNAAVDRARSDGLFLPYCPVCPRTAPNWCRTG